ncbi:MAG TPA: hypothetical protein VM260_09550, partial [Pirellula sp.]|nr:hypothetical protein [Pirellula sp.]
GIGVQLSSQLDDLSTEELNRLKALHLDHLRVDLIPLDNHFSSRLRVASDQAKKLDLKLVAGLHLGKTADTELKLLTAECELANPSIAAWLVIASDLATFEKARETLKPIFPDALFGVGHDTNFTELNRNRPDLKSVDVVSFGLNPQVHAFDNASINETLPIQGDTVRSARQFLGKVPLFISPVTLRVQAVNQEPLPGELPSNVDPRQSSLFAAGWTLGSIDYLAKAGVSRITYFETVGYKGIMAPSRPFPAQDKFPSRLGAVYPIYHILNTVGEFAGGHVQQVVSSDPASIVGLALQDADRRRLLIANLSDRPQKIMVESLGNEVSIFRLGAGDSASPNSAESLEWHRLSGNLDAPSSPLVLQPYGIARLDSKR